MTTKSLGYVLRSLYPGAFASYRGIVFRVTGPEPGATAGISWDMNLTMELNAKLREGSGKQLLEKVGKKLNKQILEESNRTISNPNELTVGVPKKVDLRFDETLDMVYCTDPNCGTMDKLVYIKNPPKDRMPTCRTCHKAPVQQAPVWIPQKRKVVTTAHAMLGDASQTIVRNMGTKQIFCHYSRSGDKCMHPDGDGKCAHEFLLKLGSLKMFDPQRPIDSLRRYNPHCPKNLDVPPIPLERLFRTDTHWYKMDFPRESLTVPLKVSAVEEFEMQNENDVNRINEVFDDLKGIYFNSNLVDLNSSKFSYMRVLEITYGYRIGSQSNGVSRYYIGGEEKTVLGRLTETQGFVLTLTKQFDKEIEKLLPEYKNETFDNLKDIALHSIKHALLVLAPMWTGFEDDKFYGSYEILDEGGKIYVYDTDEGGNGGFAAIIQHRDNFIRMIKSIHQRLNCPTRECPKACKQCLFIKNCGNVNRKLNRKIVQSLRIFWPAGYT